MTKQNLEAFINDIDTPQELANVLDSLFHSNFGYMNEYQAHSHKLKAIFSQCNPLNISVTPSFIEHQWNISTKTYSGFREQLLAYFRAYNKGYKIQELIGELLVTDFNQYHVEGEYTKVVEGLRERGYKILIGDDLGITDVKYINLLKVQTYVNFYGGTQNRTKLESLYSYVTGFPIDLKLNTDGKRKECADYVVTAGGKVFFKDPTFNKEVSKYIETVLITHHKHLCAYKTNIK